MGELFPASELISALFKVCKGTYHTAKFVGKVGYGAYAKSKEKEEMAYLQRQAIVDNTGEWERLANLGDMDAQYEYGKNLYWYGNDYNSPQAKSEGLYWLKKAVASGHNAAKNFLIIFDEI